MKNEKTTEKSTQQLQAELETAKANFEINKNESAGNILLTVISSIEIELESRGFTV